MSAWSHYPPDWPACPVCGEPALDGHITCSSASCNEGAVRRQRQDEYARRWQDARDDEAAEEAERNPGPTATTDEF